MSELVQKRAEKNFVDKIKNENTEQKENKEHNKNNMSNNVNESKLKLIKNNSNKIQNSQSNVDIKRIQ